MADSAALAADSLKTTDPDRYYATLVIPEKHRPAVTALYAFAADVASVRERVSEPAPGEIRLQWWSDALEGQGHGNVRQNPVADALLIATEWKSFRAPSFDALKDALTTPVIFDGRNLYDPKVVARHGIEYHSIGRIAA